MLRYTLIDSLITLQCTVLIGATRTRQVDRIFVFRMLARWVGEVLSMQVLHVRNCILSWVTRPKGLAVIIVYTGTYM